MTTTVIICPHCDELIKIDTTESIWINEVKK